MTVHPICTNADDEQHEHGAETLRIFGSRLAREDLPTKRLARSGAAMSAGGYEPDLGRTETCAGIAGPGSICALDGRDGRQPDKSGAPEREAEG